MKHEELVIRTMCEADIEVIAVDRCFPWSTVQESKDKWNHYYQEQKAAIRTIGIVEWHGSVVGYGSLLFRSQYPHFEGVPEIHDLWIYEEYRKNGFGNRLIGWLERTAKEKGYKKVGIGVGLYADYGSAQKLYVRLGYVPDGCGVTYKYRPAVAGQSYRLDDDLVLWLEKTLDDD